MIAALLKTLYFVCIKCNFCRVLRLSNLQRALNLDKIFREILSQVLKVPFARVGGLGYIATPGKLLNLEALKYHFWCSNTSISVKNLQ